jgi:hypothetical protein
MTTLQKPLKEYMMCSLYASVQSIEISPFLPHGAVLGLRLPLDYPPVKLGEAVNGNTILKIIDFIFYFAFYLER